MDLSFYTYGYIDAMFHTLNAIAILLNSKFGESILTLVVLISVIYYAMRIAHAGDGFRVHLGKFIGMIAMIVFLIAPRADIIIHDTITKKKEKVDNLPLGFALPVAVMENFGYWLTASFEQAFGKVSSTNYTEYGMVFGARLVQESRNWRIRTPEFMENMNSYINRCVMVDSMIGHHYTPQDLVKSDDIWKLVSQNAATLRRATMRVGKERTLMTCADAAKSVIEPAFWLEVNTIGGKYERTDMVRAGLAKYIPGAFEALNNNFKKNIEIAFKGYVGTSAGAEQLIRQQMMMNAMKSYTDLYGVARASATQESNWRIAGDLAGTYLPILMAVLKCLVYSSFVFMVPLLVISGGWARYLSYLSIVASFQLWAPLNAVLNMFIDLYSSASLSGIADNIVSFSTMSRIGNYTDKIVAVASGLQMAIPFLAFGIIQGGVGSFIHLAGTITGASQSAASQAANESVTGNKSFDNYSVGNKQLYNQSGFKTDWNESYAAGGSSKQLMDGSMERVTAGGNALLQSGAGFTAGVGATSYKFDDNRQAQVTEGVQQQEALINSYQRSLSEADRSTFAATVDRVSGIAQRDHAGEKFDYDKMGEQGKAMEKTVNTAKVLHEDYGYSWSQATEGALRGNISASTPGKFLGIGANISADGSISAKNASDQLVGERDSFERGSNARENYNNVVKAAANSSWAKDTSVDRSQSEAVRGSLEKQMSIEQQLSARQESLSNWHQAQSVVRSQGGSSSREMYQEVVDGIKQQYGVDAHTAQKMADQRSPEAQRVWQDLQKADPYVANLVSAIGGGKEIVSGDRATQKLSAFTNNNQDKVNRNQIEQVKQMTNQDSFNPEAIRNVIANREINLKQEFNKMNSENAMQHTSVKQDNQREALRVQQLTDKYEADRIGQGDVAKIGAKALNAVTLGKAGDRIGGSDKNVKSGIIDQGNYEKAEKNNKDKN